MALEPVEHAVLQRITSTAVERLSFDHPIAQTQAIKALQAIAGPPQLLPKAIHHIATAAAVAATGKYNVASADYQRQYAAVANQMTAGLAPELAHHFHSYVPQSIRGLLTPLTGNPQQMVSAGLDEQSYQAVRNIAAETAVLHGIQPPWAGQDSPGLHLHATFEALDAQARGGNALRFVAQWAEATATAFQPAKHGLHDEQHNTVGNANYQDDKFMDTFTKALARGTQGIPGGAEAALAAVPAQAATSIGARLATLSAGPLPMIVQGATMLHEAITQTGPEITR